MPSPFPGMNPYLEQVDVWHDFHERFIPRLADVVAQQVMPRYFTRIDDHVYVHEPIGDSRRLIGRGDVPVLPGADVGAAATGVMEAPAEVWEPELDVEREAFVEIRDRQGRQLITVIELLSPSNKRPGEYRDQYWAKRGQLLASGVNFVEIDLLRGGPRMPWRRLPACDYYAVVSRVSKRPRAGAWPRGLREALPTIPIPLRDGDSEAHLDLQSLLHATYDGAGYQFSIYDGQPEPPLSSEDAAWAAQFLPAPS